ncbi:FkbM family methyltransferase [Alcanivorax sp.]|uniref:FkbM family methyltransferase n=1 Tax=Alcanivorax sp. TaxID=1872427 RepID=UPI000C116A66|nr:FkbM family methyltransferase [Alcanivorax sp.]PHR67166.1 MAG: hypothetical protein COA55_08040 [Alcanivorax sp.]
MKLGFYQLINSRLANCIEEIHFHSRYSPSVDAYLIKEIFEKEIYRFQCAHEAPLIVDCGTNIGLGLLYFKTIYPDSRIVTFEADPLSASVARKNINFLGLTGIDLVEKAITDTTGSTDFFVFPDSLENIPVCSTFENALARRRIIVESMAAAELPCLDNGVDFMKVDIEGGESNVISSLVESGKLRKVKTFVIEYHHWVKQKYSFDEFLTVFKRHGFLMEMVDEEGAHPAYPETSGNSILKFIRVD